jgi:GAF domain-containing protein/HAMP domain-containing protein
MLDRFFRRLTVRRRITGGFLILILLVIVSIPLTIANYDFLLGRLQQVSDVEARSDRLLLLASTRIASSRVNLVRYIQDYAPSPYEALDDVGQATQLLLEAQDLITSPKEQEAVTVVLGALEEYKGLINDMETARRLGESQDASRLQFQTIRFGNDIGQRIEQIVKQSEARVMTANEAVYATTQQRLIIFIVGYIGLAALAMVFGFLIARSITRPISELQKGAEAFRQGHMETVIPVSGSDELGLLAQSFNQLTAELSELYRTLEQRVTNRTHRLEIVATLSERLGTILKLEELLAEVVNRTQESFGYYHVHIYLFDDKRENLVVAEGTGLAGAEMKAKGHHIPLNAATSLVARAARTGQVVRVDNVREAEDWLPNPMLPDTYSEMAVPIILGLEEQVVGVLDVQEDEIAGLDEGDAALLRSLASQVAIAIHNAGLFTEVEAALAEMRTTHERYLEQTWGKSRTPTREGHYHYARSDAPALSQSTLGEAKQRALTQDCPTTIMLDDSQSAGETQGNPSKSIVAPIILRDKTIGALHLHSVRDGQEWTEDDLAVVEAVVDQFAQSAENLRLFEDTRQRASREQMLREITEKMRAATSLDELVETAAEELGQHFSAQYALVELGAEVEDSNDDVS